MCLSQSCPKFNRRNPRFTSLWLTSSLQPNTNLILKCSACRETVIPNSAISSFEMPRIVSYTPQWLSRGSPGFDVFSSSKSYTSTKLTNNTKLLGQPSTVRRTITHRGTEIFVVAGNEIRWSDLVLLQEKGGAEDFGASLSRSKVDRHATGENNGAGVPYRVCNHSAPVICVCTNPSPVGP